MEAGRNAGCWTVGLADTETALRNGIESVPVAGITDRSRLRESRVRGLLAAGAHIVVGGLRDVLPALEVLQRRIEDGEVPWHGTRSVTARRPVRGNGHLPRCRPAND